MLYSSYHKDAVNFYNWNLQPKKRHLLLRNIKMHSMKTFYFSFFTNSLFNSSLSDVFVIFIMLFHEKETFRVNYTSMYFAVAESPLAITISRKETRVLEDALEEQSRYPSLSIAVILHAVLDTEDFKKPSL